MLNTTFFIEIIIRFINIFKNALNEKLLVVFLKISLNFIFRIIRLTNNKFKFKDDHFQ